MGLKHANPNMLLRIAQGDAFAAGTEYVKLKQHADIIAEALKLEKFLQHPHHLGLKPGSYTDDGQMSISVAEVLIEKGTEATALDYSDAFFRCFKRDPREGYSRGFQAILEQAQSPAELRQLIVPNSNKNGAAMRSVPLGVIRKPEDVVRVTGLQASVTHQTWGGINSAIAVALMSHYALHDARGLSSMDSFCIHHCPAFEHFRQPWEGPVKARNNDAGDMGVGMNTAWAVHTLLVEETSLQGIMKRLIGWGGDTDTVGAIAWGIASCRYQDEALPEFLERDLEVGKPFGVDFLKGLGVQLMEKFA